ncbi:MAG: UvrD-helicase domain-containing protein [Candidatus Hydrogenedentes bacterium]|nr:UvrD-helicase domain-containing protein [Candidatus Hydrogenedentota bacterium]
MNYTREQQQAIESEARYLCVDAGAGSGKTRVLVDRVAHLLRQGRASLEEVVAITFTEKAALEMKERLRKAFRQAAPRDDPAAFSFWRDLERRVDTAQITTIHAFCSRILRDNALFLGLDPDFAMISDAENAIMMERCIDEVLHGLIDREDPGALRLASEFSLHQLHGLCHELLMARGVVDRIRRAGGLESPEALRATWAAAAEAEQARFVRELGKNASAIALQHALLRYEGICDDPEENRELWRLNMLEGLAALQRDVPRDEAEAALALILEKPPGRANGKRWPDRDAFDALGKDLTKVKKFIETAIELKEIDLDLLSLSAQLTFDLLEVDAKVNGAFESAKRAASQLDFDDLILLALRVLRENEGLRSRTAGRIKYLLLDEFQDTDGQQLEIARLLHGESPGPALFIVGDPKQSIYYFRGAEVEIFRGEREEAEELVGLDRNFRSLPGVLDFANDFFEESNLLCAVERYRPMAVQRPADAQARVGFVVSAAPADVDPKKWAMEEYRAAEAGQIAGEIARLCGGGAEAIVHDERTGAARPASYGDIALLFRKTTSIGLYEEALRKAGIPYVVVAGAGFYERQEVVDVINVLKVLADPWNEPALLAYLRGPIVALPDDDIVRICNHGALAEALIGDALPEGLAHPERLDRARSIYARLCAGLDGPLSDLVDRTIIETGIEPILLGQFLGLQKASNVRKLAAVAREQAGRGNLGLRAFVSYLDDVRTRDIREGEAGLQPDGAGAVTLMTIHKSKGLEFPVVFIPDAAGPPRGSNAGALHLHRKLGLALRPAGEEVDRADTPLGQCIKRRIKEEEGAEGARVLYVALTRARDLIYVCGKPNARVGTWWHTFDAIYGVSDKADGETFGGKTWTARVIRGLEAAPRAKQAASESAEIDIDGILRRAAPVALPGRAPSAMSITQLLHRLFGEEGGDDGVEAEGLDGAGVGSDHDPAYAMDRGTLVHRMFELWDFAGGQPPDIPELVRSARLGLGRREQLRADLERIRDGFDGTPLRERLAGETGLLREAPFSLRIGGVIVNGTIDLLLRDGTIIDYKTGKVKPATSARYEKQLLLYAAAVRQLTGVTPARGMLVYVDSGRLVEVELAAARVDAVLSDAEAVLKG